MLNFTGSTKRRVVNLGNKSGGNVNYLEQQRLQRQQREQSRKQLLAALVLQAAIRRYLNLTTVAVEVAQEWTSASITTLEQWEDWLIRFLFLSKWYIPRISCTEPVQLLHQRLQKCRYEMTNELTKSVLNALFLLLKYNRLRSVTLECILVIFHSHEYFPGLEHTYPGALKALMEADAPMKLVFAVNVNDSISAFTKILSVPVRQHSEDLLPVVRSIASNIEFNKLNNGQLVHFLYNFLAIHGDQPFIDVDYELLTNIFSEVTFSVRLEDDRDESNEDDYDEENEVVYVNSEIIDKLQLLYTSRFIQEAISYLAQHKSHAHLISGLFFLYPALKSKLCMILTINSETFEWFYNEIRSHKIFEAFVNEESDYLKSEQLAQLYDKNNDDYWRLIYTFTELLSYWLIVSTDAESFNDEKLSIAQAIEIVKLYRSLSLTLIFVNFPGLEKLKAISITLLNQFYIKNLRMKFLPPQFFTPRDLKFNMDSLLHAVAQEEERRIEQYDSDTDTKVRKLLGAGEAFKSDTKCRLEVLKKVPFFINFKDRVRIFQTLIELDRQRLQLDGSSNFFFTPVLKLHADIRREHVLEDAFNSYHKLGATFKNQLEVAFYNEYGGQEVGIDGGGITKEFLTSVIEQGFNPESGLFKETNSHQLYPNEQIYEKLNKQIDVGTQREKLLYLRFLGNIMGKCFYENVLIDVSFAPFFLGKWCNSNMKNSINDLNYLDRELYQNLMKLLQLSSEELAALDLNYTIDQVLDGNVYNFEIMPHGKLTKVDQTNIINYVHQISNFKLNSSLYIQTKYFLEGLHEMIDSNWLTMFDPFELQLLISGGNNDVNIEDWKQNVEYGGYFDDDITVALFWEVVEELSADERCKLIKFVTSVSRAPLLGFSTLLPKFGIRNSGNDLDRLPTASTCVNLLKLPDYKDKELIKKKILYAINTGAGFEMS